MPEPGAAALAPNAPNVARCAQALIEGRLVVMPTETVYGLSGDAGNEQAIDAIYAVKRRPRDHPLIVHLLDVDQARWWAELGDAAESLAAAYWPGPLTLIVKRRAGAPPWACAGQPTVALRVPAHPVARALLAEFTRLGGRGLAAPSANRFGRVSPTQSAHADADLAGEVPLILDGGPCEIGLESTIVDLSREPAVLLRPGAIGLAALSARLGRPVRLSPNVADPTRLDPNAPRSPGALAAHYAPATPLKLVATDQLIRVKADLRAAGAKLASWDDAPTDPVAYGAQLYAKLRELDAQGADWIVLAEPPAQPDWLAVRDRLARAKS